MTKVVKKALITGITGQDESYLAEFLLSKCCEVHGLIRRASTFNTYRIDHIYVDPHEPSAQLFLRYGDPSDSEQISNILHKVQPDEVYHLGAQSHVKVSFDMPEYTGNVTALGTTRILEAIRRNGNKTRLYQAVGLNWEDNVRIDQRYFRPTETENLIADSRKLNQTLGWEPKVRFREA